MCDILKEKNVKGGVPLDESDDYLGRHSVSMITTLCLNDNRLWDENESPYSFFLLGVGGTNVPYTVDFIPVHCIELELTLHYAMVPAQHIQHYSIG